MWSATYYLIMHLKNKMQLIGIEDMAMNFGSNDKTFIKSKRELVKRFSFVGNENIQSENIQEIF